MLTKLVKRLTWLEPATPTRKGIVCFSVGDFAELQLLALHAGCGSRPSRMLRKLARWEDGRRAE